MHFPTFIDLSSAVLCGEGGGSRVYYHPDFDNVLLKVPKNRKIVKLRRKVTAFLRPSKIRFGAYREWYSEYEEYIAALNKLGKCPDFLPRYLGFVDTSNGPAIMVEKAHDEGSTDIALTLAAYVGGEDNDVIIKLLEDFFAKIAHYRIVFFDLGPRNLCVIRDINGSPVNITCVDGLGEFVFIRARVWSKLAYHFWHKRERERLIRLLMST